MYIYVCVYIHATVIRTKMMASLLILIRACWMATMGARFVCVALCVEVSVAVTAGVCVAVNYIVRYGLSRGDYGSCVTHTNESCHKYERITSHTPEHASCHSYHTHEQ